LIPKQYKTKDGLDWNVVAQTKSDAPSGSVMRPWLRKHTLVRLALVTVVCVAAFYYGVVSLNHLLAHRANPPFWSLALAAADAAVWTLMTVVGVSSKTLASPPLFAFPKSTRGGIFLLLVAPYLIAFPQLPSRNGNSNIAISPSLQVIGKTAMICSALSIFIVSVTRAWLRSRRNSST
jgi:predicted neutral ceramidase superfamily lipid hydrolase